MKTLKILIALCIMLGFSTNNAVSQKVIGEQTRPFTFTPDPDPDPTNSEIIQIPCLTEVVSGTVTEYQSFTYDTYHVLAQGVLHGSSSGEDYDISYEYNSYGINYPPNSFAGSGGATHYLYIFPILLKHDGKLVAVIHLAGQYVINGNGEVIQDRNISNVNCK